MSDVIERLLSVEQEARRIIAQAEKEADQALDHAREEARRIEDEGQAATSRQVADILNAAERSLQEQREQAVRQERERLLPADGLDSAKLEKAVRFAVGVIAYGDREATRKL